MKTKKIIGNSLNYLISAILIISGALKLVGLDAYEQMIKELSPQYFENLQLIGVITVLSGVLFAIPKTFIYGFIASLIFFGGTISAHMQNGDNYIPQIVFSMLVVLTAYLKKPMWFEK